MARRRRRPGTGDAGSDATTDCELPTGSVEDDTDCDDDDATVYPEADELCDGLDNDCDGEADDGLTFEDYYPDDDEDGYGDAGGTATNDCTAPDGGVADDTDCDDGDATIYPGADELCDDLDNDCDGEADEGLETASYYVDADGDGYGDEEGAEFISCEALSGFVTDNSDCDDENADVNVEAEEVCDGIDTDCDGELYGPQDWEVDDGFNHSYDPGRRQRHRERSDHHDRGHGRHHRGLDGLGRLHRHRRHLLARGRLRGLGAGGLGRHGGPADQPWLGVLRGHGGHPLGGRDLPPGLPPHQRRGVRAGPERGGPELGDVRRHRVQRRRHALADRLLRGGRDGLQRHHPSG